MISPTKHTNFSESLLGLGSYVIKTIQSPKSIDEIWMQYQNDYLKGDYLSNHSFDNLLLTLTFLHSLGVVEEQEGVIVLCNC